MQRFLTVFLTCALLLGAPALASTHSYHARKPHTTQRATRPYYGGGRHTKPHGGKYPDATNSHHKNGHYQNWRSGNRYGEHK